MYCSIFYVIYYLYLGKIIATANFYQRIQYYNVLEIASHTLETRQVEDLFVKTYLEKALLWSIYEEI